MKLQERVKKVWRKYLMERDHVKRSYGCVMLEVGIDDDIWEEIQGVIKDEEIYNNANDEYGREDKPHVTLLYGLHEDVPDEKVEELVNQFEPLDITLYKVGVFPGDNYDVVKFELTEKILTDYNRKLRDNVDYTNNFPQYKPHLTIAYVEAGKGEEIAERLNEKGYDIIINCDSIKYSKPNKGGKINYKLN